MPTKTVGMDGLGGGEAEADNQPANCLSRFFARAEGGAENPLFDGLFRNQLHHLRGAAKLIVF